jgi:hypothetical protein
MALVCAFLFLPALFGIIEVSYGVYAYTSISYMARQASRYAVVRGPESCVIASTFPDCNLGPGGGTNPTTGTGSAAIQTYVQNIAMPGIIQGNVSATATWYAATVTNPGSGAFSTTTWSSTACTANTTTTVNGQSFTNYCNQVGNLVKVRVSYTFPLNIPFWKNVGIPLASSSEMMINE